MQMTEFALETADIPMTQVS